MVNSTGIYVRFGKRVLDLFLSGIGLLMLSPMFVITACYIKLSTPGPVFFRQIRVGRGGRQFHILKFRSMVVDAPNRGLGVTVRGDSRITKAGGFLRRNKLDELPQLWNVLCGEMSLVGPRPELPSYVAGYTPEQRLVLSVRPGITDPASIAYRHEEELLSRHQDAEQFYRSHLLPDKLARNLRYIHGISLFGDVRIILETLAGSFLPQAREKNRSRSAAEAEQPGRNAVQKFRAPV